MPIDDGKLFFLRSSLSAKWQPGVPASEYYLGRNCWDYADGWHIQATGPVLGPFNFPPVPPQPGLGLPEDYQLWRTKPDGNGFSLRSSVYEGKDPAYRGKDQDLVLYVREAPDEGDPQSLRGREIFLAGGQFFNQPLPPDAKTSWMITKDPNGTKGCTFQMTFGELILYLGVDPATRHVCATRDPANALWAYVSTTTEVLAAESLPLGTAGYSLPNPPPPFHYEWQSFTAKVDGYVTAIGINANRNPDSIAPHSPIKTGITFFEGMGISGLRLGAVFSTFLVRKDPPESGWFVRSEPATNSIFLRQGQRYTFQFGAESNPSRPWIATAPPIPGEQCTGRTYTSMVYRVWVTPAPAP